MENIFPITGGCQCGAVRYRVKAHPQHVAVCHCQDCRKSAGAPMVSWAAFLETDCELLAGEPVHYNSSGCVERSFCGRCGTGLFYRNPETLPNIIDVQSGTLDNPDFLQPNAQIQTAERLQWLETLKDLPEFERYPTC